ncbi:MAG TPA: IS200/IS605 family transposase [Herpetosiphonaceae bacterium]|nr:IS200/IS605 family transposase [Herpetosiphonaceae bacterium]
MPYYRLYYHIVWATKERLPLITPINQTAIHGAIVSKAHELKVLVHALNSMFDHVHLLATIPPAVSIATFVGQVKGSASHLAGHLATGSDGVPFAWQAEYGVVTVSERHVPFVVDYIHHQQQHHAENRLNRTLEEC